MYLCLESVGAQRERYAGLLKTYHQALKTSLVKCNGVLEIKGTLCFMWLTTVTKLNKPLTRHLNKSKTPPQPFDLQLVKFLIYFLRQIYSIRTITTDHTRYQDIANVSLSLHPPLASTILYVLDIRCTLYNPLLHVYIHVHVRMYYIG